MKQCLLILLTIIVNYTSQGQEVEVKVGKSIPGIDLKGVGLDPVFKISQALGTIGELKLVGNFLELNYSGHDILFKPGSGDVTIHSKINVGNSVTHESINPDIEGDIRYNTDHGDLEGYTSEGWRSLTSRSSHQPLMVGDFYQGGIIFWLSTDGRHGKVVGLNSLGEYPYSNVTSTLIDGQEFTNGAGNTISIINQPGHSRSAAKAARDYTYSGYDDWYLPDGNEAELIFEIPTLNNKLTQYGGRSIFTSIWTSTQFNATNALIYDVYAVTPGEYVIPKGNLVSVRPVRSFWVE